MFRLIIFSLLFCFSCQNNNIGQLEKIKNETVNKRNDLINAALNGDRKSYNKLVSGFLLEENYTDALYYSIIIANKFENPEAYYNVYRSIHQESGYSFNKGLDEMNLTFSLFFLLKAYEGKYENAKFMVNELFNGDTTNLKGSEYYLKEYYRLNYDSNF